MKTLQNNINLDQNPVTQQNSFGRSDKYKHQDSTKIIEVFKNHTTRKIKGIDALTDINKELWHIASSYLVDNAMSCIA